MAAKAVVGKKIQWPETAVRVQVPLRVRKRGCPQKRAASFCILPPMFSFALFKIIHIINMQDQSVFEKVAQQLQGKGFQIVSQDTHRPWGGFYVIDESQAPTFIHTYFPELSMSDFEGFEKLSPKILMVAPEKRLSWQYHHRRAEIWRLIDGEAGVVTSDTDEEGEVKRLNIGDKVVLAQGERHRLVGMEGWGVVAEIWQHTDASNPSNEEDIVRLQDDFSRK